VIVIGVDPHKRTHTAVAVERATGERRGERTVPARRRGFEQLLAWARGRAGERLWALEDCRHVSLALERFLLARGERVVRVPPRLMGESRKSVRSQGKSDPIDALAVARAALRERELPQAFLAAGEREVKLLLDHHDDLVQERTRIQNRLRWHLHDLDPRLEVPAGALDRYRWLDRLERLLAAREQQAQVRIAAELVDRCRELTKRVKELERELQALLEREAAPLLALRGCGVLTAAKLIAEVGGVHRFPNDSTLAKHGGSAPLPASSGSRQRHRVNRNGNRQLNCALHRIAVNQGRWHPPARAYLARKQAEGKTRREALRSLKRHLTRVVYRTLRAIDEQKATPTPKPVATPRLT
jgi:transposase